MKKHYEIYYNDGALYGSMTFRDKTQEEVEECIKHVIKENNKNPNNLYHITRSNFKEIGQ